MSISRRSRNMALRFRLPVADVLGRTGMLKDSSARSRRKKFTSTPMRTFTKRGFPYWAFYHTRLSSETPACGVRKPFDTSGISTENLILTLPNCGLNKRWHFKVQLLFHHYGYYYAYYAYHYAYCSKHYRV